MDETPRIDGGRDIGYASVNEPRPPTDQMIKIATGSHSGSQTAQPTSYDHERARNTDRGSERKGRPAGAVWTLGRDLRIRRFALSFRGQGTVLGRQGGRHQTWLNVLFLREFCCVGLLPEPRRLGRPCL